MSILFSVYSQGTTQCNQTIIHGQHFLLTALTEHSVHEPAGNTVVDKTTNEDTSDSGPYITLQGGCRRQPRQRLQPLDTTQHDSAMYTQLPTKLRSQLAVTAEFRKTEQRRQKAEERRSRGQLSHKKAGDSSRNTVIHLCSHLKQRVMIWSRATFLITHPLAEKNSIITYHQHKPTHLFINYVCIHIQKYSSKCTYYIGARLMWFIFS